MLPIDDVEEEDVVVDVQVLLGWIRLIEETWAVRRESWTCLEGSWWSAVVARHEHGAIKTLT
jgi:hypothetical protein